MTLSNFSLASSHIWAKRNRSSRGKIEGRRIQNSAVGAVHIRKRGFGLSMGSPVWTPPHARWHGSAMKWKLYEQCIVWSKRPSRTAVIVVAASALCSRFGGFGKRQCPVRPIVLNPIMRGRGVLNGPLPLPTELAVISPSKNSSQSRAYQLSNLLKDKWSKFEVY